MNREEALSLYRPLLLVRRAEEKICEEYATDKIKSPVHLAIGGEAISVGVCHCLPEGTKTFGTYRNHALYLAVTNDTDGFFAELYGKATGPSKGKAGSMHLAEPQRGLMATSAVVGTTIPVAVGAALAEAYRLSSSVVVSFFGDGATEEGVFWESLNFACLRRLRILFVCEDNGLAIHTPKSDRQGFRSIRKAVRGFDCYVDGGDGSDINEVVAATRRMLRRMADRPRPGFLHFTYIRLVEHVGVGDDFAVGYRRRPSSEQMETLDPVRRFQRELAGRGWASQLEAIAAEVDDRITRSVQAAKMAPFAAARELYTDVLT